MEVPRNWRLKRQRYLLIGEICPHCDERIFPPRDICIGIGCGKNTFTQPLTTRVERKYYGEKGVILKDEPRNTRMNIVEILTR
jgi:uncharacterized OB-fold protein